MAADRKLTIRVKSKNSQNMVLKDVEESRRMEDFLLEIEEKTGVQKDRIILLTGFPPRRVHFKAGDTLQVLGLQSTDNLIVQEGSESDFSGQDKEESSTPINTPPVQVVKDVMLKEQLTAKPLDTPPNVDQCFSASPRLKAGSKSPSSKSPKGDRIKSSPLFKESTKKETEDLPHPPPPSSESPYVPSLSAIGSSIRLLGGAGAIHVGEGNESNDTVSNDGSSALFGGTTTPQGILMRKEVASDNSCLFRSLRFCISGVDDPRDSASSFREIIAEVVRADQEQYNEAILGRPNAQYCDWILNSDSWGGGIELAILSEKFGLEISVIDTQSLSISYFGEDKNYSRRIFLIYDSIHYDPLYLEPFTEGNIVTTFSTTDSDIVGQALELAREAKASHQFTDLKNFTLLCEVCKKQLTGESEAQEHAKATGHASFSEIN